MIAGLALFLVTQVQPKTVTVFQAPAEKKYAEVKPGGTTILPNGRFLTPIGQRLYTGSDLWNVITDPTGTYAVDWWHTYPTVRSGHTAAEKAPLYTAANALYLSSW